LETAEVREAIASVEAMVCESLVHCYGPVGRRNGGDHRKLLSQNAFGRQVIESRVDKTSGAIAAASGTALSGLRSAAFVSGDQLTSGFHQLQAAATRHISLLVHTTLREGFGSGSSHSGYHGASDLGLFQILPHTVQQSVDFTLVARWLAERALVPGLIGYDRYLIDRVYLPSAQLLRDFLAPEGGRIPAPTPAQMLLFGEERNLVPRWFDFDRPISFSSLQGSHDGAAAAAGRHAFFGKHLKNMAQEGMDKLELLTGRPLSFISSFEIEKADFVVVTQGSAFTTACTAVRHLNRTRKQKVGVLGLTWLRPFPAEEVRNALSHKRGVLVLECVDAPLVENTPLYREVQNAVGDSSLRWRTGVYGINGQPLHVGELAALIAELQNANGRRTAWLGITTGRREGNFFPKRQGLIQAVSSDYREIADSAAPPTEPIEPIGDSVKSVQWIGSSDLETGEIMSRLAEVCTEAAGQEVKGFGWAPEPGVFSIRIISGKSGVSPAEAGSRLDLLLLSRHGLDLIYNPLTDLVKGAAVIIESSRSPIEIWSLIPETWRSDIRRLGLRLFTVNGGFEDLVAAAAALLSGSVDLPFEEVDWSNLSEPESDPDAIPGLVRRVSESGAGYDSLPRFWGEVMQPKRGGISDNFPDPLTTLNAVPPYTAALARPRGTALPNIPVLEPEKCTGCGICWPVCPDSAIGVTAITVQELLDAAASEIGREGKLAAAVKRAHKPVAARIASEIKKNKVTAPSSDFINACYANVAGKLRISADDRVEHDRIFKETAEAAASLKPMATEKLFHEVEQNQKDSGRLLVLAINPDACQGCQLCITSCPESALVAHDRAEHKAEAGRTWKSWENLADTSGLFIAQQSEETGIGPLAASLLSRHTCQVQAVGSFGDPGSGERLALRLVTSLVESTVQKKLVETAQKAGEAAEKVRRLVHEELAAGLEAADAEVIQEALKGLPRRRASLTDLNERLKALGKGVSLDPVKTLRLTRTAQDLEDQKWSITRGVHGLGRSRFGIAIISDRIARWAGRFPNHPYLSPQVVEVSPEGGDLVLGLAVAAVKRHVERIREMHRAELYLENPPDLPGRLAELEDLSWKDLSEEEKLSCPPLLVLTDETALRSQGIEALDRLLGSDYPVKVVLVDSRDIREDTADPSLLAVSRQTAYVVRTSLAAPRHLAEGIRGAVTYAGSALIHIHAPIPSDHGFTPSRTVDRARAAVEARVHPLVIYDPSRDGVFGAKFSLEGNPAVESRMGSITPIEWALGEERYRSSFSAAADESDGVSPAEFLQNGGGSEDVVVSAPESGEALQVGSSLLMGARRCLRTWDVYREIAGLESPFVDRIRGELITEVEAEQRQKVEEMRKEYEAKIAELQQDFKAKMNARLRDRLLAMAGFNPSNHTSGTVK